LISAQKGSFANIIANGNNNNKIHREKSRKKKRTKKFAKKKETTKPAAVCSVFPPRPAWDHLIHLIISGFCNDTNPSHFEEAGCAVCGQLTLLSELKAIGSGTVNWVHGKLY
jgi:hypothetical protein